jgi:tRNA(fMet)-specific endonuclease VapC
VKYLLDTNVLSDFARGDQAVMARLRQEAPPQLAVSVITEMEVEYGLARNPDLAPRVREAMRMLLSTIPVLPFEREDARVAAQLRASLNSQGTPIGAYDLLLAACALRRGLAIVTHNTREFTRVGGLGLEDWHSPGPTERA